MSPVVSHRPISVTLAILWLGVEGAGSIAFGALALVGAFGGSAFDPGAGAVMWLSASVVFSGTAVRLVVAVGLYTLQSWGRPAALLGFGSFTALNGSLYALDGQVAGGTSVLFALAAAANLAFFLAVVMQPGAFNPTRLGGPDGTATNSNPHR